MHTTVSTDVSEERAVLPHNCVLAIGLPTTEEDFFLSIRDENREYARRYLGGWQQYRRTFVAPLDVFIQGCREMRVRVAQNLRSSDFRGLFYESAVVTLFTHWTVAGIEFADGTLPIMKAVEAVPDNFSGVFDLAVCHPNALAGLLLRDRPLCSVRYLFGRDARPAFWFPVYTAVYRLLALGGRSYRSAFEEVILELQRQSQGVDKSERL